MNAAAVHEDSVADLPNTTIDLAGVGAMEAPVTESHSHLNVLALAEAVEELTRRTDRSFASDVGTSKPW